MSDLREALIGKLAAHQARAIDAHEAAMTRTILRFVETEPRCAERSLEAGHLTGSAWIVDRDRMHVLLTHHRKLDRWLQLGGHADGDLNILSVAQREAMEESGLTCIQIVDAGIFDVDCHRIPARKNEPEHWHYDIRFLLEADRHQPLMITAESKDLSWVPLDRIAEYSTEESLLRMARKTPRAGGARNDE